MKMELHTRTLGARVFCGQHNEFACCAAQNESASVVALRLLLCFAFGAAGSYACVQLFARLSVTHDPQMRLFVSFWSRLGRKACV